MDLKTTAGNLQHLENDSKLEKEAGKSMRREAGLSKSSMLISFQLNSFAHLDSMSLLLTLSGEKFGKFNK